MSQIQEYQRLLANDKARHIDTFSSMCSGDDHNTVIGLYGGASRMKTDDLVDCADNEKTGCRPRVPSKLFAITFVIFYAVLVILIEMRQDLKPPLMMFRGISFVVALYMLLSVDVCGWEKAGLGPAYKEFFFKDASVRALRKDEILRASSVFGAVWSLGLLLFAFTANLGRIFFVVWSLSVWVCLIVYGLFVCKCSALTLPQRPARLWFLRVLFRVVTAPFWEVQFADFWLADQLCSLTQTMMDLEFTVCYLFVDYGHPDGLGVCDCPKPWKQCIEPVTISNYVRPAVACLPSFWRFAQCLRVSVSKGNVAQLINAGKYLSQFPVVIFSSLAGLASIEGNYKMQRIYMALWITSSVSHSIYVFVWDVMQDWGLCSSFKYGNCVLSRQLYYQGRWKYYCAIVIDFFLRFSWSVKLSIQFGVLQSDSNDLIVAILAMLEVIRRFIWNFFRIENEHFQRTQTVALLNPATDLDT
jgi:hypothetical protein